MMWISARQYRLPFTKQVSTSQVNLKVRQGWWLWLHSATGDAIGIGEVAPWVGFGAGPDRVSKELEQWSSVETPYELKVLELPQLDELWGDAEWLSALERAAQLKDRLELLSALEPHLDEATDTPEVRCGVELAILDALARRLAVPLAHLLEPRAPLSAPTHTQVQNLDEAVNASLRGYRALKLKVGVRRLWADELKEIAEIRAALPHINIRLDANQGWDTSQARGALLAASPHQIEWIEEPCQRIEEYASLPQHGAPVGLDEQLGPIGAHGVTAQDLEMGLRALLTETRASVVTLKPMALGGLTRAAHIAITADRLGAQVCITHTLGSAVERSASAHLAATLRANISLKISGLGGALEGDLASPLAVYGGELRLEVAPGLAINLSPPPSYASALTTPAPAMHESTSEPTTNQPRLSYPERGGPQLRGWVSEAQRVPHPLEMARRARPDHIALRTAEEQWSYAELYRATCLLASELTPCLIAARQALGGSIALSGAPSVEWSICFYALTGLDARVISLNPRLTQSELHNALKITEAELMITLTGSELTLTRVKHDERDVYEIELTPLDSLNLAPLMKREVSRDEELNVTLSSRSWERALVTICTSGSTGSPQAISLTARQLYLSAFGSMIRLGHRHDDVWLSCLPPHHIGGLSILIRGLLNQITVYLCPPRIERVFRHVSSGEVTLASLTPTLLSSLVSALEDDAKQRGQRAEHTSGQESRSGLRQLRALLIGGGPTPRALWDRASALELPLKLTWGMSETASQLCTQLEGAPPGTPLPPLPFVEVNSDHQGRLWVSGPLTARGVLGTGDVGVVCPRGVTVQGRFDDAIISGGVNLSPREIEEALSAHPAIASVAVVGGTHVKYGARPVAFIVLNDHAHLAQEPTATPHKDTPHKDTPHKNTLKESSSSDAALSAWCRERLSNYKVPDAFVRVEELPLTALGKIKRVALRSAADQALQDLQPISQKEREDS